MRSLDELIYASLEKSPSEPCVWWSGVWWSRGALWELVEDCIVTLEGSGFRQGDKLALILPNCPLFLAVTVAVWRLGGSVVPMSPASKPSRILKSLALTSSFGVVVHKDFPQITEALNLAGVRSVQAPFVGPLPAFEYMERNDVMEESLIGPAVIFLTSGTTDEPKAVLLTHENLIYDLDACLEMVTMIGENDVFLNALPNFHALGFSVCALIPLIYGLPQAVVPSFMPVEKTLDAIRKAQVTVVPAVPLMVSLLVGAVAQGSALPTSLAVIITGGDRLQPRMAERAKRVLNVTILEGYGLTETSPVLSVNPNSEQARRGTCGKILSCFKVEARNADGRVVAPGEEGQLWVQGKAVASSYYKMPELTANRFVDGWFDTQDIVRIDEEGYLTVISRVTDVIIVGGYPVYPGEVERVVLEHPSVADVAVLGIEHGLSGSVIKAFVVLKEGQTLSARDLIRFCHAHLPYYKTPRSVEFVDALPRSSVGEVLKRKLKNGT